MVNPAGAAGCRRAAPRWLRPGGARRARYGLAALLLAAALPQIAPAQGAPARVVSMNLCTDQLALMLAAPGQLVSVSYLAHDPGASAMAAEAAALPVNHGQAEEIWLLAPDLVLAGRYTTRTTTSLLERLGVPVVVFEPENDFDGIRANIRAMGAALGQGARAEALIARFDADLAALRAGDMPGEMPRPRAALWSAGSYTSGDRTLAGQILAAAGFANIATEAGLETGGALPLETLLLARPDMLIMGRRYPGHSRDQDLMEHPSLAALRSAAATGVLTDRDWVCGTPYVLRAVAGLRAARASLLSGAAPSAARDNTPTGLAPDQRILTR